MRKRERGRKLTNGLEFRIGFPASAPGALTLGDTRMRFRNCPQTEWFYQEQCLLGVLKNGSIS